MSACLFYMVLQGSTAMEETSESSLWSVYEVAASEAKLALIQESYMLGLILNILKLRRKKHAGNTLSYFNNTLAAFL